MIPTSESLYVEVSGFVKGSAAGLLQLLVAAADRRTFQRIVDCPTYPAPARTAGLSVATRLLRDAMTRPDVHVPTILARLYVSVRTLQHRKRAGQFFTARDVARWVLSVAPPALEEDVCDAGAGTGVFADALMRAGVSLRCYVGVENDPVLALCAAHVLESIGAPSTFRIWYANFLLLRHSTFLAKGLRAPTLVIANPPFVRFHRLSGRARILTSLNSTLGVKLSAFSGAGSYFLSRAAELVGSARNEASGQSPTGRLLFLLPKDAAGAAHARRLRDDLQRRHGWIWREYHIPALQTCVDRRSNALALLFVFERGRKECKAITVRTKPTPSVGDLFQIRRGISTGCNAFFVLTDGATRQHRIPKRYLRPVLPTRIPMTEGRFAKGDWDRLRQAGYPCWLLTLPNCDLDELETPVREYLKDGVRRGLHSTPTAQRLRTWFAIPIPSEPADVFVTYLFRGSPRFVLNEARVLHLTNILGGRFLRQIDDPARRAAVVDVLNEQGRGWINRKLIVREYRGGLMKIEPRELSKLPLDDSILNLAHRDGERILLARSSLFD